MLSSTSRTLRQVDNITEKTDVFSEYGTQYLDTFSKGHGQVCEQEAEGERQRQEKAKEKAIQEDFGDTRLGRVRTFCWNMTEYPETGRAAQVGSLEMVDMMALM